MGFFVPHHEMGDKIYLDSKTLIGDKRTFNSESLSKAVSIAAVGDKGDVLNAVRYTRKHKNIKAIGIRDEKKTGCASEFIFSYPTDLPPEKEVFFDQSVAQFLFYQYHLNLTDIIRVVEYKKTKVCFRPFFYLFQY